MSLMDLVKLANAVSNPQEAQGMALNALAKRSPETAAMLSTMIKRGDDPAKAIRQFAQEGKISTQQLDELQQVYGMARKMGLRNFNVPDHVWEEARQAIGGVASDQLRPNSGSDWF